MLMDKYYKESNKKIKSILLNSSKKTATGREVISKDDEWSKEKEWDEFFLKLSNERGNGVNE